MKMFDDMERAKEIGLPAYMAELNIKIGILEHLLENYDDGRRKSFYCLAVNLLEQDDIDCVVKQARDEVDAQAALKEKAAAVAALFKARADERGIVLKLRK